MVASRLEHLAGEVPETAVAMPRNPHCAPAFDETDTRADLVIARNGYHHVDMVGHQMPFLNPVHLLAHQFMEQVAKILIQQSEQTSAATFPYEHHMTLGISIPYVLHFHLTNIDSSL